MRIGFLGLGRMGSPMARVLARAGHRLTVYNRTASRAEALAAEGAAVAHSPGAAAREAEVLVTMVADDQALTDLLWHGPESALGALPAGATHVCASTALMFRRTPGDGWQEKALGGVRFVSLVSGDRSP